ncbi:hypothetical protein FOCC_FOCC012731 [Frankliniella occidentalis]|uniref:Uncharacterized protein K02A2.6-like n=1 Tax=Frankliniella occidentalis TaxID=133901 RepID=A0A6J1TFY4_FRAOC|nr:uncharacterized protein K02A2.6-like [Frankliniella occidentalis]KAE8741736.1 hypothetical protein FOCC_FOCC012731 [Frankliniella occidentalis]
MVVGTEAGASIIPLDKFKSLFPLVKLSPSPTKLSSASGDIRVSGEVNVCVSKNGITKNLCLIVCQDAKLLNPLLGRPWLDALLPGWGDVFNQPVLISSISVAAPSVEELRNMFPKIFDVNNDEPIVGFAARLLLQEKAAPVKHRAYKVPFALIDPVNAIVDKMVDQGKAVHVRHAEWASPSFPVPKKNGEYRLVVDFKKTLNPQLRVDHYPIPSPEEIFSDMSEAAYFVSLDLKDAYMQLPLSKESQELCIMNTPRGFYKLLRLPFGIASAAAIFQSVMEEIVGSIKNVKVYLDNLLIHGDSLDAVV